MRILDAKSERIRGIRVSCWTAIAFILIAQCLSAMASGQLDPGFAPVPSKALANTSVRGQIVQPDGRVLVWGAELAADGKFGRILRLDTDGSVDTSFTYCGCLLIDVKNVFRQSDGKFLAAGVGINGQARVVRLNIDGSRDDSFEGVPTGLVFQSSTAEIFAIQTDGKVLATMSGSNGSGFHSGYLVRLNADGTMDTGFIQIGYDGGRLIYGYVRALELDDLGRFYLAIATVSAGGGSVSLKRYTPSGAVDATWESPAFAGGGFPGSTNVAGLDLQGDGSLLVSGNFSTVNGVSKANFVRILPAGNVDLGFTVSGLTFGGDIRQVTGGKILVTAAQQLARLNSDGSADMTFSHPAAVSSLLDRWALDGSEGIYFFGQSTAGDNRLYRLSPDGSIVPSFNPNLTITAEVYAQALQNNGKVIIAGTFTQINGSSRRSIARLNANGSIDPTFDAGSGFDVPPTGLAIQTDGSIIAVGGFSSYNGTATSGLARINPGGGLDNSFAPTVNSVYGATVQTDDKILIYGAFSSVNGSVRERIARLNSDGSLDTLNASIAGGSVYAVLQQSDGRFIVGGSFTGVDGFNRSNFVRLNSDGSLDQTLNASGITSVNSILIQPDGKYVCGLGAGSAFAVARRNSDGSSDAGFNAPTFVSNNGSDLRINSFVRQADGSLIVGGNFNYVNNTARNHLVRLSANGTLDRLFLPGGANSAVRSLIAQPDGNVLVGGDFSALDNAPRVGIARIVPGAFTRVVPFDFDGDGLADIAVFRPAENKWYVLRSSDNQVSQTVFGVSGDKPVPADFDGDGRMDLAIFRASLGDWWSLSSISGAQMFAHLGASGDIPLPSDISGDGRADYVVYRPSNFVWYRVASSNGATSQFQFGAAGDKPVIGDIDGDGKFEPVIFRPSTGDWWWQSSVDNIQRAVHWGIATDVPTAADFDGDGKTDFAVYRPSEGIWYIRNSSNDSYTIVKFGISEDKPVAADYDGDGKADIAVFRPSTGVWYLLRSSAGFAAYQFGISTDIPAQNAFVP